MNRATYTFRTQRKLAWVPSLIASGTWRPLLGKQHPENFYRASLLPAASRAKQQRSMPSTRILHSFSSGIQIPKTYPLFQKPWKQLDCFSTNGVKGKCLGFTHVTGSWSTRHFSSAQRKLTTDSAGATSTKHGTLSPFQPPSVLTQHPVRATRQRNPLLLDPSTLSRCEIAVLMCPLHAACKRKINQQWPR